METPTLKATGCLLLLGGLPLAGLAQAAPPTLLAHRLYLGGGALVGNYQLAAKNESSMLAPMLSGGLRLSPRWALEASLLINRNGFNETHYGSYFDTARSSLSDKAAVFRSVYQQRTQALSLLARYTLTRQPARRLQLDAVAGVALAHTDTYGYNSTLDQATGATIFDAYYARYNVVGGCLQLGAGVRYRLAQRVELASEYLGNFAVAGSKVPATFDRLSRTLSLSARYYFGRPVAEASGQQ